MNWKPWKIVSALGVAAIIVAVSILYSGLYPVGADVPHFDITYKILETARERSIARASHDIVVPDLSQPQMLLGGGQDYNAMCASCHLKPGETENDMTIGLYPKPPNLTVAAGERVMDTMRAMIMVMAMRRFGDNSG